MSEAHDGPTVVVITPGAEAAGGGGDGGEVEAIVEAEAVEEIADSAVEIAAIEADRDITLAVIAAETTEAMVEASHDQELAECRTEIARLAAENEALRNPPLVVIEEPLTSAPLEETPPNQNAAESEALSPVTEIEAEGESPPAPEPPPKAKKFHRWI